MDKRMAGIDGLNHKTRIDYSSYSNTVTLDGVKYPYYEKVLKADDINNLDSSNKWQLKK